MTIEQRIDQALAYFTDEEHLTSYELLPGAGNVMLSAPHAVLQTRAASSNAPSAIRACFAACCTTAPPAP